MKDIVVIHHANCDDGFGAAYVAWLKFKDNAEYIPMSYGETPPDVTGKDVYVLDFSFEPYVVMDMIDLARSVHLLDHHKSAREQWATFEENGLSDWTAFVNDNSEVRFDMTRSGAMMTWDYFHLSEPIPRLIRHIQDNDLWKFEIPFTKEFIRNMRSHERTFEVWDNIRTQTATDKDYMRFIEEGMAIERFFNQQCKFILDSTGTTPVYLPQPGRDLALGQAINASPIFTSELGNIIAKQTGTYGMVWSVRKGLAYCSLRSASDNCDVSIIAGVQGGGGHRRAAGFTIPVDLLLRYLQS